jgi:hypothetical protein
MSKGVKVLETFAVPVSLSLVEQFFAALRDNDDDNVDDEN